MTDRFDHRRAAEILERAAELQLEAREASSDSYSIADLEQAAAVAGIDGALVRRAAAELEGQQRDCRSSWFLGGPSALHLEASADVSLTVEDQQSVSGQAVDLATEHLGEFGSTEQSGGGFRWTTDARDVAAHNNNLTARRIRVSISPRGPLTKIQVEERFSPLVGGLFGGIWGGVVGGTVALPLLPVVLGGLPWLVPVVVLGWMGLGYMLVRRFYARTVARRRQQLQQLLGRLEDLVRGA